MPDFDVVLFGPTGVTGREVARYLSVRAPALGLRWAVAGRNRSRIDECLAQVVATPDGVLRADVDEPTTIEAMAASTSVVANLVGPYARFGEPVYAACAAAGVHQLDLTGEIDWVRAMIDRHDDAATQSGAKIVPTAGFESIPFDLGSLFVAHALHRRTGDPVVGIDASVTTTSTAPTRGLSDMVSGGTYTSMIDVLKRGIDERLRDPYVLDAEGSVATGTYDNRPRKHPVTGQWLGPMMPAPFLNPPVVHRSASLLRASGDSIFGPGFRYREGMAVDALVPRAVAAPMAAALAASSAMFVGLGALRPSLRVPAARLLERIGPKAGDGPSPDSLDAWTYRVDLRATDARGATQDAAVTAAGHPGYKSTAMMIGEAAIVLADERVAVPEGAGFLTPSTALGLASVDRFVAAGLEFTLV